MKVREGTCLKPQLGKAKCGVQVFYLGRKTAGIQSLCSRMALLCFGQVNLSSLGFRGFVCLFVVSLFLPIPSWQWHRRSSQG